MALTIKRKVSDQIYFRRTIASVVIGRTHMELSSTLFSNHRSRLTRAIISLCFVLSVFLMSSEAHAQKSKDPFKAVEKRDKNRDGKVSRSEWDKSAKIFKIIDKDKDGFLSPSDFAKHWGISLASNTETHTKTTGSTLSKDRVKLAKQLLSESQIADKGNRNNESLKLIRKAATVIEGAIVDPRLAQKIFYILGKREYSAGNPMSAIKATKKSAQAKSDPSNLTNLVLFNLSTGRVKRAEAYAKKARMSVNQYISKQKLRYDKRLSILRDISVMEATLLQKQGLWKEAEPKLRKAMEHGATLASKNPKWWFSYLKLKWSLAKNLLKQHRAIEAEIIAREGFDEAQTKIEGGNAHAASLARFVGEALLAQGRVPEAQEMAEQAVRLLASSGEPLSSRTSTLAKRFLGMILALQENWYEANQLFMQTALDLADKVESRRSILDNNPIVILTAIKNNRGGDFLEGLEKKLTKLQKRVGDQTLSIAKTRTLLAIARAQMGEKEIALDHFSMAVPVLMSKAVNADFSADEDTSNSYKAIFQREALESYIGLLADYYASGKRQVNGIDIVDATFQMADTARGSIVQKALAASGARAITGDKELSELVRTEQDGRKEVTALNALLAESLGRPRSEQDADAIEQLRSEIETKTKDRRDALQQLSRKFPEYVKLVNPKPASLTDARGALVPGEALITTYFAPDRSYVWAVNAEGKSGFASIDVGAEDIADSVATLRYALDPGASGLSTIPDFDVVAAYELYAQLFKPLEPIWKSANNLVFVGHGPIGSLPISVLPTKPALPANNQGVAFAAYKNISWLAKTHSVSLIPSVAALTALRRLPAAPAGRSPFIGFGDPYFNQNQTKPALEMLANASNTSAGISTRGVPLTLRSVSRGAGLEKGELAKLPRLPDTAAEVESIAGVLINGEAKSVYLGRDASEKNIKSMDLSKYRVLTFATHGLVPGDLKGLTQPALAMAAPQITGDNDDGLLTMEEILNLKLNADWVVLSACNTATGNGDGAEALSGLGQAFFYAGTRSLLASNWPVETVSAKILTTGVFRIQATDGSVTRAQALRLSMMDLMNTGVAKSAQTGDVQYAFAHPIFWAPFSLIGDGR